MAFGGYAVDNSQTLARMYPGGGYNPADVYRHYGNIALQQKQQASSLAENQRQFDVTSGQRQEELDAMMAERDRRFSLAQQQFGAQQTQYNRQYGMNMFQAGIPGYSQQFGGGQDFQYQIPGSNVQMYGQPGQQMASQLALNKLQYQQPMYAGGGGGGGGGGMSMGGGGSVNDLAKLMSLRTASGFSRDMTSYSNLTNMINKMTSGRNSQF